MVKCQAIRETWAKTLPKNVEVKYFVGRGDIPVPDDVVQLNASDTYDNLPEKVHAFFKWALAYGQWDYLFKCDDDTYVRVPQLNHYLATHPEIKYFGSSDLFYASGGGGYALCRPAVQICAAKRPPQKYWEDVWVGLTMCAHGVSFISDSRLHMSTKRIPHKSNNQITCHWISPEQMRKIHADVGHF